MRIGVWAAFPAMALVACAVTSGLNSEAPSTSWGKAGVTMNAYLNDASVCASMAATVHAPPEALVQSHMTSTPSATPGSPDAIQQSNDALLGAANEQRDAQVRADQHARLRAENQCLRDRGYSQFRLTAEQRAHAETLPPGSLERATYLHQLASDPAVLSAQHM